MNDIKNVIKSIENDAFTFTKRDAKILIFLLLAGTIADILTIHLLEAWLPWLPWVGIFAILSVDE